MRTLNSFIEEMNRTDGWAKTMTAYYFRGAINSATWIFSDSDSCYHLNYEREKFNASLYRKERYFFNLMSSFEFWCNVDIPYSDFEPDLTLAAKAFDDYVKNKEKSEHDQIMEYLR